MDKPYTLLNFCFRIVWGRLLSEVYDWKVSISPIFYDQLFWTKVVRTAFLLEIWLYTFFEQKNWGKSWFKMLVKLTTGQRRALVWQKKYLLLLINQIENADSSTKQENISGKSKLKKFRYFILCFCYLFYYFYGKVSKGS